MDNFPYDDEKFLNDIKDFPPERQRELTLEYNEVVVRMRVKRVAIQQRFPNIPGNVLQRQAAACYQDGSFLVFWEEEKLMLKLY